MNDERRDSLVDDLFADISLRDRAKRALSAVKTDAEDWYDHIEDPTVLDLLAAMENVSKIIRTRQPNLSNFEVIEARLRYFDRVRSI